MIALKAMNFKPPLVFLRIISKLNETSLEVKL